MNRRKLLFRTLGLLASKKTLSVWRTPIITAIALPVHAQTSSAFRFGKFSSSSVCLDFFRKESSVLIEAKFGINNHQQGSTEVSLEAFNEIFNNTNLRPDPESGIQIILDQDCNDNQVNAVDSIVIENIVGERVIFAIWVEKYLSGYEAYPGGCEFNIESCET